MASKGLVLRRRGGRVPGRQTTRQLSDLRMSKAVASGAVRWCLLDAWSGDARAVTASRRDRQCGRRRPWDRVRGLRSSRREPAGREASGSARERACRRCWIASGPMRADLGGGEREVAVDRLGVLGCRGCAAQNGDLRAAESGCRARSRGKSLRFLAMWEARRALGRVRARWWAAICRVFGCMSRLLRNRQGAVRAAAECRGPWRERQPAAVGVTRSLIDGSVASAHLRLERCRRGQGGCSARVSRSSGGRFRVTVARSFVDRCRSG